MKRALDLPLVLLLFCAGSIGESHAVASVSIHRDAGPFTIEAPGYSARIEGDGCLTNLRVSGREFLAPGVAISRGSYFFLGSPLKLAKVERGSDESIVAENDAAAIRYDFGAHDMRWMLQNKSDAPLVFFFVFAKDVKHVFDSEGRALAVPANASADDATFVAGDATLQVRGGDRLWGPWQGPHQVLEVKLEPDQSKEVELSVGKLTNEQGTQILALTPQKNEPALQLISPRRYQVVQRTNANDAAVLVSGRTTIDADAVRVRISGDSVSGPLPAEWQTIPIERATGDFLAHVTLPAGGWYSLEAEAMCGDNPCGTARVDPFGVGEVFVGAGQSNSTNSGEERTKQASGMVASFGGDEWQLANDPQPGVADRTEGGSFWPAFGDAMYTRYHVPIGVATTGFGGTSVNQWQPDGDLFPWMMTRIHQLGPGGFRALLWHQGESDVEMAPDEYFLKLQNVIRSSRRQAGWAFPWFVAQTSYHNPQKLRFEPLRQAQARTWKEGLALRGPDTDTLTGDCRDLGGLGIHFSPKGLRRHGQMWAECVGEYLDTTKASDRDETPNASNLAIRTSAKAWPEADELFHRDPKWFGGDDAYSIDLGNGRVAWFFGDSFVEPTVSGQRKGTTMVRNSVGIQTGYNPATAEFKTYWREHNGKPASFIEDEGDEFFWPGGSLIVDGKLIMFLMRAQNTNLHLGFDVTGWGAVLIENPELPPDQWTVRKLAAPQNDFRVLVGSGSLVLDGEYLVAFSVEADNHDVHLVRWPLSDAMAGDLSKPEWWDASQQKWIDQAKLATPPPAVMTNGQTEFTVHYSPDLKRFLLFQVEGYPVTPIGMRTAPALTGPWSPLTTVFDPSSVVESVPDLMIYAAKAHPELTGGGMVLTFATNTQNVAQLFESPNIYYPRFVRVTFDRSSE